MRRRLFFTFTRERTKSNSEIMCMHPAKSFLPESFKK